jgi:PAS domain S-box-containing protein
VLARKQLEESERALRESEQRYRTLLERANDAIFVFPVEADGRPGRYLEVNEVACGRLGYSRDELLALSPEAIVDTGDVAYVDALDAAIRELRSGCSIMVDRIHVAKDGRRIPVEVSATLLELGGRPTVIAIARDVTERRRAEEAVRESEERLRFTLEAAKIGTWEWKINTGRVRWSDNLEEIHGLAPGSFKGDFESVLADVHPDDRARVEAAIRDATANGGFYHVEYRLPDREAKERWVEGKGRAFCDESGRPVRMAGICMNISERKQSERTLELLLHELEHRVKNTLAVVQSLATHTLRSSASYEAFESFRGRLAGLADAHSLLSDAKWQGAELSDLIIAELSPWQDAGGGRLHLAGPPVVLAPKAALTLGMVFHELATNAVKHGALSTENGRIEVRWSIENQPGRRDLRVAWSEFEGPSVQPPSRRSFGTQLIERSVAYELAGEVRLDFRAEGLCCELGVPLAPPAAG